MGTNEGRLIEILCPSTNYEIQEIRDAYFVLYNKHLENDIKGDASGPFKSLLVSVLQVFYSYFRLTTARYNFMENFLVKFIIISIVFQIIRESAMKVTMLMRLQLKRTLMPFIKEEKEKLAQMQAYSYLFSVKGVMLTYAKSCPNIKT